MRSLFFDGPSAERFANLVIAEMRRQGVTGAIHYDDATCSITKQDGTTLHLASGYGEYCAVPFWQRQEVVRRYSELHRTGPRDEPFEQLRPVLVPMVADRLSVENTRRISPQLELPGRPIADHLTLLLAVDYPDRLERITAADLRAWGLGFDDALRLAADNLWRRSNEDFIQTAPGVYASPWRDQHDASRLALTGLIWQLPVRGRHVVSTPNRNTLLVTGEDDADGLVQLAELTDKALTSEPHPLTGIPLVLDERQWSPFLPPPASPAHRPMRMLTAQSRGREYTEQQAMLDAENTMAGRKVHIARFALLDHPKKGLLTWCNWVEGEPAWLPRTDLIAFIRVDDASERGGGDDHDVLGFAPWERVAAVAGDRLKALSMFPPRYETVGFPSRSQLKAIRLDRF